jgi:ring-1,2-phenylacetyl-CoA epoxidase subunit PaaD
MLASIPQAAVAGEPIPPSGSSAAPDAAEPRVTRAWQVLAGVLDPEVPVVSVCELGIVRDVFVVGDDLIVALTPTYSGCPATEVIEQSILDALVGAGLGPVAIEQRRAPAWTTDWISAEGRSKLLAYGIVPPGPAPAAAAAGVPIRFIPRRVALHLSCPRCASDDTERLAAFGSTACKALYRCRACGEPFEHFKAI